MLMVILRPKMQRCSFSHASKTTRSSLSMYKYAASVEVSVLLRNLTGVPSCRSTASSALGEASVSIVAGDLDYNGSIVYLERLFA